MILLDVTNDRFNPTGNALAWHARRTLVEYDPYTLESPPSAGRPVPSRPCASPSRNGRRSTRGTRRRRRQPPRSSASPRRRLLHDQGTAILYRCGPGDHAWPRTAAALGVREPAGRLLGAARRHPGRPPPGGGLPPRLFNPLGTRLFGDRIVLPRNQHQVLHNTKNRRRPETIVYSRNSLGLRGPEPPASFATALTVIAVGGSTTESRYQSDGDTWPERTGRALAPHFRDLWVGNAGLDGHSTYGHLLLLEQYLVALRPRLLVFLVGINDVGRDSAKRVDEEMRGDTGVSLFTHLARVSALAATLQNLGRAEEAESGTPPGVWRPQPEPPPPPDLCRPAPREGAARASRELPARVSRPPGGDREGLSQGRDRARLRHPAGALRTSHRRPHRRRPRNDGGGTMPERSTAPWPGTSSSSTTT